MFSFEVNQRSDLPLWLQLRSRIIYLIEAGQLKPGDQLPTVRGLATELSINYNTVNKTYLSLASEGYIESTRGRGAFVKELPEGNAGDSDNAIAVLVKDFVAACRDVGLNLDDIQAYVSRYVNQQKYEMGLIDQGGNYADSSDIEKDGGRTGQDDAQ